jgi:methyl-accepting chemotaxis protein
MPVDDQPDAPAEVPRQGAHVPKWAAILRRNAPLSNSPGSALAQTLGQVIADLEHLNRHTEQDFLRIGGKLAEFIEAVNLISAELTALADWEHGQRASQALASALDLANQMTRGVHEGNSLLGSMRQEAERLKHTLAEFNQTVATFRTLG